jgi:hypothetical protein
MDPNSTAWQPTLPGLTPPTGSTGSLAKAAVATIAALEADGLIEARHALTVQLILGISASLDADLSRGKITVAMSQATKQLLDAIDSLPTPDAGPSDEWDEMVRAFADADRRARAAGGAA